MTSASVGPRWATPVVLLHWGSALLIAGLATAGFVMSDLDADSGTRLLLSRLHSVFGVALMLGTVARLVIRTRSAKPEPLPLPALHRRGIAVTHGLLYATLFGLGASGALTGALSAWPQYLQGQLTAAPQLEQLASREVHEALVFALGVLIMLHVGGVLVQELRGGGALRRMRLG